MNAMVVSALGGNRYAVRVRGHELIVDQPADVGGTDLVPHQSSCSSPAWPPASRTTPAASSPATTSAVTDCG